MGCHTDLGYSHQIQGFYSQRLYGESFENFTVRFSHLRMMLLSGAMQG
jgi:hypothetical protein